MIQAFLPVRVVCRWEERLNSAVSGKIAGFKRITGITQLLVDKERQFALTLEGSSLGAERSVGTHGSGACSGADSRSPGLVLGYLNAPLRRSAIGSLTTRLNVPVVR